MITGTYLRQLRDQANLSQQDVASHLGVSQSTYCAWESKQRLNLRVEHLRDLSLIFGVPLSELMEEPKAPSEGTLFLFLEAKIAQLQHQLKTLRHGEV